MANDIYCDSCHHTHYETCTGYCEFCACPRNLLQERRQAEILDDLQKRLEAAERVIKHYALADTWACPINYSADHECNFDKDNGYLVCAEDWYQPGDYGYQIAKEYLEKYASSD